MGIAEQMDLGRQPAATAAQGFALRAVGAARRPGRGLMGADNGTIQTALGPVQPPGGVLLSLQGLQDLDPQALLLPADIAIITGLPGAIAGGHIPPGGPVRRRHKMPLSTCRCGCQGWPRFLGRSGGSRGAN